MTNFKIYGHHNIVNTSMNPLSADDSPCDPYGTPKACPASFAMRLSCWPYKFKWENIVKWLDDAWRYMVKVHIFLTK